MGNINVDSLVGAIIEINITSKDKRDVFVLIQGVNVCVDINKDSDIALDGFGSESGD